MLTLLPGGEGKQRRGLRQAQFVPGLHAERVMLTLLPRGEGKQRRGLRQAQFVPGLHAERVAVVGAQLLQAAARGAGRQGHVLPQSAAAVTICRTSKY